ncbi:MAG: PEP-CTERM sorting domain-containing protein [Gemmataceae bacterium]|nr:PEP-CTERM sorting domain-containing protein [Gemmataceae bacterium]
MRQRILTTTVVALSLACTRPASAEFIDLAGAWNGSSFLPYFGVPGRHTGAAKVFGQTFTVEAPATVLDSFSFRLRHQDGADIHFAGYIMEWNSKTERLVGPILYQSTMRTLTAESKGYQTLEFEPGAPLAPGKQYAALISTAGYDGGPAGRARAAATLGNVYSGGVMITDWRFGSPSPFGRIAGNSIWDTAFTATFSRPNVVPTTVPEPGTLAMATIGAFGLVGWACRRTARGRRDKMRR